MGRPLVHGTLRDYATGDLVDDTDDERLRQRIAHRLIDRLGYRREELDVGCCHEVATEQHRAAFRVDFTATLASHAALLVRYCPGALVAPERPTIALARLLRPYVIPRAVLTNGHDARLLDAERGVFLRAGLDAIPHRRDLAQLVDGHRFVELEPQRRAAEARILLAFEALECECDRLPCGVART